MKRGEVGRINYDTRTLDCAEGHEYVAPLQRGPLPSHCPDHGGPAFREDDFAPTRESEGRLQMARVAVAEAAERDRQLRVERLRATRFGAKS